MGRERERESCTKGVCVCVFEREEERKRECVCVCMYVCVYVCVYVRFRPKSAAVREGERGKERHCVCQGQQTEPASFALPTERASAQPGQLERSRVPAEPNRRLYEEREGEGEKQQRHKEGRTKATQLFSSSSPPSPSSSPTAPPPSSLALKALVRQALARSAGVVALH